MVAAGFYGSLGPALVRLIVGTDSLLLGGMALFVLAASAGTAVLLSHAATARTLTVLGITTLVVGSSIAYLAIACMSPTALLVGMVLSGAGFGTAFQGAVRSVVALAPPHQQAGVLSLVYVVSYLAIGLPAVIAGYLVVDAGGVLSTAKEYALAVVLLAALAGLGALRPARPEYDASAAPRDVVEARVHAACPAQQPVPPPTSTTADLSIADH